MNTSPRANKPLIFGTIGTLWLLAVLLGYVATHKPFSPVALFNLLLAAWRVAVVSGIVSFAGGLGFRILGGRADQPLSQTTVQSALGLGILGAATLILGAALGLNPWLFASILTVGGFLLRKSLLGWWQSWSAMKQAWNQSDRLGKTVAIVGLTILACAFLVSLAPPLQFDALTYHLAIPRAYLQAGRVEYLPENMFWGMPEETEMLYTLAMLFGGNEAATFLGWAMGFLTLTGLLGFAYERFGQRAAWAALACLLAGETLSASLAWGYVEWPSMLFGISLLIALDHWLGNKDRKSIALAGVFASMALATKYTTGILLIAGTVVILSEYKKLGVRSTGKTLLLFGALTVLVIMPWLTKNFLATGNPFYPLLFPSGAMDQIRVDFYQKSTASRSWFDAILLPWQATVLGVEGGVGYSASIGPLLLGLSPLAGLGWRARLRSEKDAIRLAAIVTVVGLIVWAVASQWAGLLVQSRLYFAMFPAWAILGGAGFAAFGNLKIAAVRFGRIAAALVLLASGFSAFEAIVQTQRQGALSILFGLRTTEEYTANNLGWYAPAMQAVRELPPETRVLMLWETRSLACLPQCDPDEVIDQWFHDIRVYKNAEAVLAAWQAQGYTHLLFRRDGAAYARENETSFVSEDWAQLDALLAKLPPPVEFGESYSLYPLGAR
jgi:hypothetical protein